MLAQLPIGIDQPRRSTVLALRPPENFVPGHSHIHYLTAYLGAVTGGLGQRGMVIHAVELMPVPQTLSCSITFAPPLPPAGFSEPAWVAYEASWDEHRGWCCLLHHVAHDQSRVRRYFGEPVVPAPEAVADFIAGLSRVQTLGTLGPAPTTPYRRGAPRELADDLIRFIPPCTWVG